MPEKLDSSIVLLRERIEEGMRGSADLILEEFKLGSVKGLVFMFDGLVSNSQVSDFLLRPLNRLEPAGDTPEVFVLSGAGTGISVYRKLQRENVPFATGVLYENDVDYRLAPLLAAGTVSLPAFAPPAPAG